MAVVRGGYSLDYFSTATRREQEIHEEAAYLGFRCVSDVEE